LIVGKTGKDKCMHIKTDYMIDNITDETHLEYINNLPMKTVPIIPRMDFGFLVELVGEVEINLGKVQHLTH
jgi:hypothetical protein